MSEQKIIHELLDDNYRTDQVVVVLKQIQTHHRFVSVTHEMLLRNKQLTSLFSSEELEIILPLLTSPKNLASLIKHLTPRASLTSPRDSEPAHRFIRVEREAWVITIPSPIGSRRFRRISFASTSKAQALKKAIEARNELGRELWSVFWDDILNHRTLLSQIPYNFEPRLVKRPSGNGKKHTVYTITWNTYDSEHNKTEHTRDYSIKKLGKDAAYKQARDKLLEVHAEKLPLMRYLKEKGRPRFLKMKI